MVILWLELPVEQLGANMSNSPVVYEAGGVLISVGLPYLSSLPILAVVYRFFYLPTANLPIYHNLPISTDFFEDLPNFNFFYRSFCYFM